MRTIQLPDSMPLADIIVMLSGHGLRAEWCGNGIFKAVPRDQPRGAMPSNANVAGLRRSEPPSAA